MTIGVCKDCQGRYTACWGSCERYLEAKKELEARKAAKLKAYSEECAVNAVLRKYRR